MGEVIIVVVRDDNSINVRNVWDLAWRFGVAFGAEPRKGGAAVGEDWVEKDSEAVRELDVVAGMAEPGCSKSRRASP